MEREDETGVWMTEEKEAGGLKMNGGLDEYTVVKPERRKSHNNICISISFFPVFPETLWNPKEQMESSQTDTCLFSHYACLVHRMTEEKKRRKINEFDDNSSLLTIKISQILLIFSNLI